MLEVISRTPSDDSFTFNLFKDLLSTLKCDYKAYYMWTSPPFVVEQFLYEMDFGQSPNVILGFKDMMDLQKEFNFWHDTSQALVKLLDEICSRWEKTNFIVFTSLENVDKEYIKSKNLYFIPWGGDITNQIESYKELDPVMDKNFNSNKTFISLNRNKRSHRLMLISYLYGMNLNEYGHLSYLQNEKKLNSQNPEFLDLINWEFSMERHEKCRDVMIRGYQKVINDSSLTEDDYQIYENGNNNNIKNFNSKLRNLYRNSFIEIVTETSFTSPGYLLTEKTWHVFSGCNFPIFLFGVGGVSHLRSLGLDLFDDIVDHSYDTILNPIDRIISAVDLNQHLLTSPEKIKSLWKENKSRFEQNIKTINTIDIQYKLRTVSNWNKLTSLILK